MKSSVKTTDIFFNRGCLLWVIKRRPAHAVPVAGARQDQTPRPRPQSSPQTKRALRPLTACHRRHHRFRTPGRRCRPPQQDEAPPSRAGPAESSENSGTAQRSDRRRRRRRRCVGPRQAPIDMPMAAPWSSSARGERQEGRRWRGPRQRQVIRCWGRRCDGGSVTRFAIARFTIDAGVVARDLVATAPSPKHPTAAAPSDITVTIRVPAKDATTVPPGRR